MLYLLALLIGIVAGLRAMTAPAAVSWGAALGWVPVSETWAAFMGYRFTPWIFSVLALIEFVTDQLPSTPSRKVTQQFAARIVSGGFCGAVLGATAGATISCAGAGVIGAILGTLGGAEGRARLAAAFGQDRPAAFIEDAVAIVLGLVVVAAVV